ncbi:GPI-anchored surface protein, putative [Bodo saltans]|uniref:GPI-anchored surface protein, putative n=1 Tax=Bodo saltans TaxID=75058 RepID=A0A0S4IQT1_BODSA|nr:GPI-anchored surface protein, putative [Bodo saltans]|eukprot:CUF24769.1 GPI-anchored surface protein, putative [Bodo saltans]
MLCNAGMTCSTRMRHYLAANGAQRVVRGFIFVHGFPPTHLFLFPSSGASRMRCDCCLVSMCR